VALAEGGTLFLDEIGELPLNLQVKLLRPLQQRSYEPVGSSESVVADFRLVAATNRDLLQEVRAGRFRQDLYYRLNVCPIHLPPLRHHRGDLGALFQHFWRQRGEHRPVEPMVLDRLERYSWPGNVRELENLVERVSVIAEGAVIEVRDLPPPLCDDPSQPGDMRELPGRPVELLPSELVIPPADVTPPPMTLLPPLAAVATPEPSLVTPAPDAGSGDLASAGALALPVNLPVLLRQLEEAYIAKALARTGGNKKEAARLLGMGRTTLVEKLRRRNSDRSGS
jgi:sigma-54 dependent transcriptional regulator, flagellar regulatory protein